MQKILLAIFLLLNVFWLSAIVVETGNFSKFLYGDEPACAYDNWISHIAEKIADPDYNLYAPYDRQTTGFGDFRIPSETELTNWGNVIDQFVGQNWQAAQDLLTQYGYPFEVVQFNDTETGRTYYLIRELLNLDFDDNGTVDPYDDETGAFEYGWGMYVYNPAGTRRVVVTTPHPCDDFPTPVFSYEAFKLWDAKFWLINGAGREVKWTNVGSYSNAKSLSDPTRVTNHPFNTTYTRFCNQIRTEFNARELSIQIHTYDWNRHEGYGGVQISAGYQKYCPNLPIRDLSRFKNDMINSGDAVVFPANTIGTHSEVDISDYYSVFYDVHTFTYDNNGTQETVNNLVDLPAYSQNYQMSYTLSGWNDYDVYDPFFHIEMDELPNYYTQTENNLNWFYGWNEQTQKWDYNHLFDRFNQFYGRWVTDLNSVLDATFAMNDNSSPTRPTNLAVFSQSYDYITLQWNKSDDFDFDTYEILYATEPIGETNYSIFSRANNNYLASPYCEQINVTGLSFATQYYFKIRGKDKNGNYSSLSNEVSTVTAPANITNFRGVGRDGFVEVKFGVASQQNNLGFRIYRKEGDGWYSLLDSYATNPYLAGGTTATSKSWTDSTAENDHTYTYKVSCVNLDNVEFPHNFTSDCTPRNYYTLYFSKVDNSMTDSLVVSINQNASDGNDGDYDITKSNPPSSSYLWAGFWEQYWGNNGTNLYQEVHGNFDLTQSYKQWSIRVKSDQLNQQMKIRVDDSYGRNTEKLYIRENSSGTMIDLDTSEMFFTVTDTNYKAFTLYWGNLKPAVTISAIPNRVYQGGSAQTFYWGSQFGFLVDHYNLSIQNGTDSLLVATGLANNITSYNYAFPTNVNLENCKFYVDAWAYDGELIRKVSNYTFGIVPLSAVVNPAPGLLMQANVWTNSSLTVQNVYGADALGWTMDTNGAWWQIPPFNFGLGYWIEKVNPFEYSSMNPIQRDSLSISVRMGWNIIPNPHLCTYGIEDLRFWVNGSIFTFAEMIDQMLISRGVYVYRNGKYEQTEVIYPYESFLLQYYGNASLICMVNFIPFNAGPAITPIEPEWQLKIAATQPDSDGDAMIIGVNALSTDDYEFRYDLPEPPVKPIGNAMRMYLYHNSHTDTTFVDTNLNAEFKSSLPADSTFEKTWDFKLDLGNSNPVQFTLDSSLFPTVYSARISIGDWNYWIQNGDSFSYTPPAAGLQSGTILVRNQPTGNDDHLLPALSALRVYPNPFNPETRIAFSLGKQNNVSVNIYNIKGQLVKSLHQGALKSGNHSLTWNGKDDRGTSVGTGIYFAKVKTGSKSQTIKMMLMK